MGVYGAIFHYHNLSRHTNSFFLMQLQFHIHNGLCLRENSDGINRESTMLQMMLEFLLETRVSLFRSRAEERGPSPLGVTLLSFALEKRVWTQGCDS